MFSIAIRIFAFAPFPELIGCDYEVLTEGKTLLSDGIVTP
jgi:hypothetical protein